MLDFFGDRQLLKLEYYILGVGSFSTCGCAAGSLFICAGKVLVYKIRVATRIEPQYTMYLDGFGSPTSTVSGSLDLAIP
jgi:hypothetical protein